MSYCNHKVKIYTFRSFIVKTSGSYLIMRDPRRQAREYIKYYLLLKEAFLHMNQVLVLHWRSYEERAARLTLAACVIYKLPVDKRSFRGPERARTCLLCSWQLINPLLIMHSYLLGKCPGLVAGPERGQQHFRHQTGVMTTAPNCKNYKMKTPATAS